jgi:hypothetical protein
LGDIFTEKGKRRIGNDNIGLLEQFDTFGTTEIAITLEVTDADFFGVGDFVVVLIAGVFEPNRFFGSMIAK